MTSLRTKQLGIWVAAAALSFATLLLPTPEELTAVAFHVPLIIETILASLSIGAALLFLTGLSGFKVKLKVAYALIAIGMVIYAFALVQLPILQVLDMFTSTYVVDGYLNILYVIASLLLLAGVLRYGKLLQAEPAIMSPIVIALVVAVSAIVSPMLPHSGNFYHTASGLILNVALTAATAALLSMAAIGLLVVKRAAGPAYTKALAWSFLGVSMLAISTISTVYFQLNGFTGAYVMSGLFFVPFLVAVICNLRGAVAFNNISLY